MGWIGEAIESVTIREGKSFENLTVFALCAGTPRAAGYLTLDQALGSGRLRVGEVSEGGSVPQLLLENDGSQPVLILDGEELRGGKQNRVVNTSILVPPRHRLVIPVSCVEAGRWSSGRGRSLRSSGNAIFARARAAKAAAVSRSLRTSGEARSDQGDVWERIREKQRILGLRSRTDAMAEIFEQTRLRVQAYDQAFRAETGQVGAVFAIDGEIEGLELFDAAETLQQLLPKLVRSYALDACETAHQERAAAANARDAQLFLAGVAEAPTETYPGVGLGEELRVEGEQIVGAGLVVEDRLVHVAAFRKRQERRRSSLDRSDLPDPFNADFLRRFRELSRRLEAMGSRRRGAAENRGAASASGRGRDGSDDAA